MCFEHLAHPAAVLKFNQLGWTNALLRRPAGGQASPLVSYLALALAAAFAPVERSGLSGTALTLMLRKDHAQR